MPGGRASLGAAGRPDPSHRAARRGIAGPAAAPCAARCGALRLENPAASRRPESDHEDPMICRPLALAAAMLLLSPLLADDFFVDGRNGADLPGNGRSRQTPWKTVAYALAQIPAPAQGTAHALRIAG